MIIIIIIIIIIVIIIITIIIFINVYIIIIIIMIIIIIIIIITIITIIITANMGEPIIKLANPSGSIPGQSSITLDWYFYPLEATVNMLSCMISTHHTITTHSLKIT
jgi:hypothetical protein